MEAPEKNGTKIPAWQTQFAEIEKMVEQLGEQRDSALNLLEHAQRELALALMRIEELEGKDEAEALEKESRDA